MNAGVIFLDKPLGWTSRRAVNEVIRMFSKPGEKKIKAGHTGTLDPLATGMLPILLGEATRFSDLGLQADKRYRVSLDLTYQTDTLDCEGEITARFDGHQDADKIREVVASFEGKQQQVPPIYSAIRVDGRRAHAMARAGETVTLESRSVDIQRIEILELSLPVLTLDVTCSKGTYIRSLARDIGGTLGLGGCVTALRRISTGGWPEAMMVTAEHVHEHPEPSVLPLRQWLREWPDVCLSEGDARRFLNGQRVPVDDTVDGTVVVMHQNTVLGTAMLKAGQYRHVLHPLKILPSAQKVWLNHAG